MGELSLTDILTELIESEEVVGCGFGDKNGLTLAVEGKITVYVLHSNLVTMTLYFANFNTSALK